MFELLTRRRLIYSLVGIFIITVVLLLFAHSQTTLITHVLPLYHPVMSTNMTSNNEPISSCHISEPFEIIAPCEKCTSYERKFQATVCSTTGFKQGVLCSKSNIKTSRSCPKPIDIERQEFWLFECFVVILAVLSIVSVRSRQRTLDKQMAEKIKRQIGDNED
jgi:hypothetical protein